VLGFLFMDAESTASESAKKVHFPTQWRTIGKRHYAIPDGQMSNFEDYQARQDRVAENVG
jgi:hypothetical protein